MSNFWNVTNSGVNNLHMGDITGGTVTNHNTATIHVYNLTAMEGELEEWLSAIMNSVRENPEVNPRDLAELAEHKEAISTVLKTDGEGKSGILVAKVSEFADILKRVIESASSVCDSGDKLVALIGKTAPLFISGVGILANFLSH